MPAYYRGLPEDIGSKEPGWRKIKMAEEKTKAPSKISKIHSKLNQGWKDVEKIAEATEAAVGTVRVQMYKFYKANPDKRPAKVPKAKTPKKAAK